jgi:hypothetical protein
VAASTSDVQGYRAAFLAASLLATGGLAAARLSR